MKYYSASNKGFFDNTIHQTLPSDAVEVADEDYQALLNAQAQGSNIVPGSNGYPTTVAVVAGAGAGAPSVIGQLTEIDQKKIRALTDAILTGDHTRLLQLEQQAALLRPHLGGGQ